MKTFTSVTSGIQTITPSLARGPFPDAPRSLAKKFGRRLALPFFLLGAALLVQPCAATPFQWEYTGSLDQARNYHTATLLSDGRVLVAGGYFYNYQQHKGGFLDTAELYDSGTGKWTYTGSLNFDRHTSTATLLPDGRVLVAAGFGSSGGVSGLLASAELYDPATGNWTVTGSLNDKRTNHTATLLPNGQVLVAGGNGSLQPAAELYDPATGTWTFTGNLNTPRGSHTATLLPDGKVLVAGGNYLGDYLASAELYDPATGNWTFTGSMNIARQVETATLLPDGKVLVAGGSGYNGYISRPRNSMIQPRGIGRLRAALIRVGLTTPRRC